MPDLWAFSDIGEGEAATYSRHNLDEALGVDSDMENCAVGEYHRQCIQRPDQARGGDFLIQSRITQYFNAPVFFLFGV